MNYDSILKTLHAQGYSEVAKETACSECGSSRIVVEDDDYKNYTYVVCMDCDSTLHTPNYLDIHSIAFYLSIGIIVQGISITGETK